MDLETFLVNQEADICKCGDDGSYCDGCDKVICEVCAAKCKKECPLGGVETFQDYGGCP